MRTIIELPGNQLDALDALCRRERISRAEAIRQAVAAHIAKVSAEARTSVFGIWRDRPLDGLQYERGIRAEWDAPRERRGASKRK